MGRITMRKMLFRFAATIMFCVGLLVSFVFNPSFLYAEETNYKNFIIHHNGELDPGLMPLLDESFNQLQNQELFDPEIRINVCLNDGSVYPKFIETLMGPDVIRSFAFMTVIQADNFDVGQNRFLFSAWNHEAFRASQWLGHSFTHCLQYKKYGLLGSNPIARHDEWKWEGYAEYTTFGLKYSLTTLIKKHLEPSNPVWMEMEDGSKTLGLHLKFLIMIKYCIEVRGMTYGEILAHPDTPEKVYSEVLNWSKGQSLMMDDTVLVW